MAARLLEITIPDSNIAQAKEIISKHCRRFWQEKVIGGLEKFSCIVQNRYTERFLAELSSNFDGLPGFNVIVIQVEALSPPLVEAVETSIPLNASGKPPSKLEAFFTRDRISTEELYDDIGESIALRPNYLLTVILSAVIAALGMRSGQTAVVIGAMVIAPLLGPTMALAMAATVGNAALGRRAFATLFIGIVVALIATILLGMIITIDPSVAELRNRTIVQPADIALALACGAAGVLAFSRGASLALVGVMIAVALVPPIAAAGLFFGSGFILLGYKALFLLGTNLVCVNVAGIAMFLLQGLPPKDWRITSGIFFIWIIVLALFIALVGGGFAIADLA